MKKGFTIIEIIISIGLIAVIGTILIIYISMSNNNKKEKEIAKITSILQEASSVYLAVNKETNSSILENIQLGGTGYVIPIKTLLKEGYITETHIKTLQDNGVNLNVDKAYMLAAAFSSDQTKCTNSEYVVTIEPSYELEQDRDYYLCNFTIAKKYIYYDLDGGYFTDGSEQVTIYNKGTQLSLKDGTKVKKDDIANQTYTFKSWNSEKNCGGEVITSLDVLNDNRIIYACYETKNVIQEPTYKTVFSSAKFTNNFDKIAVSEEWCNNNPGYDTNKIVCDENGIYTYYNQDDGIVYNYARGAVKNNYLKFKDKMWRIVWMSSENKMKLVLDDEINIKIDDKYAVTPGQTLYHIMDAKAYKNVSEAVYNKAYGWPKKAGTSIDGYFDFWYLDSSIKTSELLYREESGKTTNYYYNITYDLNKAITINNTVPYYYSKSDYSSNCYRGNSQFNASCNIYYKTMYNNVQYSDTYIYGISDVCYTGKGNMHLNSSNLMTCSNINSGDYTKDSKVTYLTIDELKMAGIGTTVEINGLDNYLLPNDNDVYYLSEIYDYYNTSSFQDKNYYISKYGLGSAKMLYYNSETCYISSKQRNGTYANIYYRVFYKNGICEDPYCMAEYTCGTGTSEKYSYLTKHYFKFNANAVKPAIVINLDKVSLSDSLGTESDPYYFK